MLTIDVLGLHAWTGIFRCNGALFGLVAARVHPRDADRSQAASGSTAELPMRPPCVCLWIPFRTARPAEDGVRPPARVDVLIGKYVFTSC